MSGLVGHLVMRFAAHPENWAIESLHYLLSGSRTAANALVRLLGDTGLELARGIRFQTQVHGEDRARPDLEGRAEGRTLVILETKFWAGLTDNQPVAYLQRLPTDRSGVLCFIVPARRLATIWGELALRCRDAGQSLTPHQEVTAELRHADLPSGHKLTVVSWRVVLTEIIHALQQVHDREREMDADQLLRLCERMDRAAFLPLLADELSNQDIPRRHLQLAQLANEIGMFAIQNGLCTSVSARGDKLATAQGVGYAGRYLNLQGATIFLGYDCQRWAAHGRTPLWIRFDKSDPLGQTAARRALEPFRLIDPPRLIEDAGEPWVPLALPAGQEKLHVTRAVLGQIAEIGCLLSQSTVLEQAP